MSKETGSNRDAVVELANSIGAKTIVEIGVRRGRLSIQLHDGVPTLEKLVLIDCWLGDHLDSPEKMQKNARQVKRWARQYYDVTVLHMRSERAVQTFEDRSIDFLHVDGDHSWSGVTNDIRRYLPKVRPGGIISGDDYNLSDVKKAVDKLVPNRNLIPGTRLWWAVKE